MSLIRNEKTKLTATFVNGMAIALFAVGAVAPVISGLYGANQLSSAALAGVGICILTALGLHMVARYFLNRLES